MFCKSPAYLGTRSVRGGAALEDQILGKGWRASALIIGVDVRQYPKGSRRRRVAWFLLTARAARKQ